MKLSLPQDDFRGKLIGAPFMYALIAPSNLPSFPSVSDWLTYRLWGAIIWIPAVVLIFGPIYVGLFRYFRDPRPVIEEFVHSAADQIRTKADTLKALKLIVGWIIVFGLGSVWAASQWLAGDQSGYFLMLLGLVFSFGAIAPLRHLWQLHRSLPMVGGL